MTSPPTPSIAVNVGLAQAPAELCARFGGQQEPGRLNHGASEAMNLDDAIDLAIDNTIEEGLTDVFDRPFEVELLEEPTVRQAVRDDLSRCLKTRDLHQFEVSRIEHILVPKGRREFDYRRIALMSPSCHLKYLALAILAAPTIERSRIPLAERTVFSYRFAPEGRRLFSDEGGYRKWKEEIVVRRDSQACRIIVKCDLASFYDRLNLHRLEATLESIGVEPWLVKALNDVLIHWAKRDSYGLPVGGNASRILAEAALIGVDETLRAEGIEFVRFVDDYRFFAPALTTAQQWMGILTKRLFCDGLVLNAAKTSMYPAKWEKTSEDPEVEVPVEKAGKVLEEVVVAGGYRRVARRYKRPTDEKFAEYKKVDLAHEVAVLRASESVDFLAIQRVLLAALARQQYDILLECNEFIERCVAGLEYTIDLLLSNADMIPAPIRADITKRFEQLLVSKLVVGFEWYQDRIVNLLSAPAFLSKPALIAHVRESRRTGGATLSTAKALERLPTTLSREEVLRVRELYGQFDAWEKRRLMRLVFERLPREEARAWARAIEPETPKDIFTRQVFRLYRKRIP